MTTIDRSLASDAVSECVKCVAKATGRVRSPEIGAPVSAFSRLPSASRRVRAAID